MSLGAPEIFIVLFIILLLFGAKKLPELAKGMGKGIKEFKKGIQDVSDGIDSATENKD
jgi:sec-independent protein translocase protein TatA